MQEQELNQVAGGSYCRVTCRKCIERFIPQESCGTLRIEGSGCHKKYYCICPACGYEWEK